MQASEANAMNPFAVAALVHTSSTRNHTGFRGGIPYDSDARALIHSASYFAISYPQGSRNPKSPIRCFLRLRGNHLTPRQEKHPLRSDTAPRRCPTCQDIVAWQGNGLTTICANKPSSSY
jgi:hypothetical protein